MSKSRIAFLAEGKLITLHYIECQCLCLIKMLPVRTCLKSGYLLCLCNHVCRWVMERTGRLWGKTLRLHVNVAENIGQVISKGYKRRHSDYVSRQGKLFCSLSRLLSVFQNICKWNLYYWMMLKYTKVFYGGLNDVNCNTVGI